MARSHFFPAEVIFKVSQKRIEHFTSLHFNFNRFYRGDFGFFLQSSQFRQTCSHVFTHKRTTILGARKNNGEIDWTWACTKIEISAIDSRSDKKREKTNMRTKQQSTPCTRMVWNSMSTMLNYNNVKTVPNDGDGDDDDNSHKHIRCIESCHRTHIESRSLMPFELISRERERDM